MMLAFTSLSSGGRICSRKGEMPLIASMKGELIAKRDKEQILERIKGMGNIGKQKGLGNKRREVNKERNIQ